MSNEDIEMVENSYTAEDRSRYKTFRETYKIITFALGVGMIYPNTETEKRRRICIAILLLTAAPLSFYILMDIYDSWLRRDIINVIRHCTIVGPFLGGFFKMLLMFYKRVPGKRLIDEIDHDYATYNHLPPSHKVIVDASLNNNIQYTETCWVITVVTCVMIFPVMAAALTVYNYLFVPEPTKYMVHDMNIWPLAPERRFESPYYEIMFVYMFYSAVLYVINFAGYDGFFGLTINHACLKIQLYCRAFEDAMKANSVGEMRVKIARVIKEQNRMFEYVGLIQDTFNMWLGVILIATMIQICNCMYHITEGYALDLRYIIFILGTVVHIYLPCRYSAKLKHECQETATSFYCSGWEHVRDMRTRRDVSFMIARGQIPNEITAFNMLVFDMDLFVSILQTSYSMYTLLRS